MPTYPSPGKGLVISGINKEDGWGSRNAAGQVIAGHAADQGINHTAGKVKTGLDTASNPVVTSVAESAMTSTGITITWTTAVAQPNGQVYYQLQGAARQATLETGGPFTNHSVALTGLTPGGSYSYVVYQPAAGSPPAGKTEAAGTFILPLVGQEEPQETPPPTGGGTGGTGEQGGSAPVETPTEAPAFDLTQLQVTGIADVEATVQWRTSVYADGTVQYHQTNGQDGPEVVVEEGGAKRLNHSVFLGGLLPGCYYRVAVVSADASGNLVTGGPLTFSTEDAA